MELISSQRCFEGEQRFYRHDSTTIGLPMRFGAYLPPQALDGKSGKRCPTLFYLAGHTCTEETFVIKAGAQRLAAELGLIIITPDTSPRGANLPGEADSWDFGLAAGFYLDATQAPWNRHYRMYSYIVEELRALVGAEFPVDVERLGIFGHSMGGHGALTIALKSPDIFKSVSAFAPIASPMRCPWGEKALTGYLGADSTTWREYDATALIEDRGWAGPTIRVDQGTADKYLEEQLKPELLQEACAKAGVPLQLRLHESYDHSYYFISTFMEEHLRFHSDNLYGKREIPVFNGREGIVDGIDPTSNKAMLDGTDK